MYIVKLIRNLFIFQLYNIYVNEEIRRKNNLLILSFKFIIKLVFVKSI